VNVASTIRLLCHLIRFMSTTHRIRAAVIDWAGTMVDYGSRAPANVFQEIFRREGVPITPAQAREPMGMAKRAHIATVAGMSEVDQRWQEKFGRSASAEDVDRMYEKFLPLQKKVLADHCDMIPGAVETFLWCIENDIRVGSSTGYTRELMEIIVPTANAAGYKPEVVLCAEDAPEGRPAPWLIFECMKRLNVYPASQVVKVDDTTVGIEAGINAGAWTVGITKTGNLAGLAESEIDALSESKRTELLEDAESKMKQAGAHFTIEGVHELPATIAKINSLLSNGQFPLTVDEAICETESDAQAARR